MIRKWNIHSQRYDSTQFQRNEHKLNIQTNFIQSEFKNSQKDFSSYFLFFIRFKLIEEENLPQKDLKGYLKDNKRQLWTPKSPQKEVERGLWNENYLKKLHDTLKVKFFNSKFHPTHSNFFQFQIYIAISSEEIWKT